VNLNRISKWWWGVGVVLLAPMLMGPLPTAGNNPWDSTPFEANPTATDPVSQGDDHLREHAREIRERAEVEHEWGTGISGVSGDNGLHRLGSARCFIQNTAPTLLEDGDAPLDYNNTGGAGTATLSANESVRTPSRTVGHGRCWIDLDGPDGVASNEDDNTLWVYVGGTGFVQATNGLSLPLERSRLGRNLLPNGSFEVGTSTTAPDNWTAINTPTLSYSATPVSEGTGQEIHVTAADSMDEGIRATLTDLKANRSYFVVARAMATAGDTCSLRTTGATTNITDTTATIAAYEDLTGTFVTNGTVSDVNIFLEADANGDICAFDHAAVYELGTTTHHPLVPSSSSWVDSYAITGDLTGDQASAETNTLATSNTFVIESPNCWVDLRANVAVTAFTGDPDSTTFAIQASVNGGVATTLEAVNPSLLGGTVKARNNVVEGRVEYPLPGDTYTFTLVAIDADTDAGTDIQTNSVNRFYVTMNCPGD
jgi:hypothetical protein